MSESYQFQMIIVAAPEIAHKMEALLQKVNIHTDAVFHHGEEALAWMGSHPVLILTTYQLPDMSGMELASRAGEMNGVVMIVPHDYEETGEEYETVHLLHNPVSPDALAEAVRAMQYAAKRFGYLVDKVNKLEKTLADRKVIERAKGKLMEMLHLSERDAHYRMQKRSMDCGRRIADVAREVLEAEEIPEYLSRES